MFTNSLTSLLFVLASVSAFSSESNYFMYHSFMEDNNLHLEDSGEAQNITEEMFNKIINVGKELHQSYAKEFNEELVVNALWEDPTVNANVRRSWGTLTINMYGGLARRSETTPEGFALVLCHEFGHAYGGVPYLRESQKIAAEGQADYWGAGVCAAKIIRQIKDELPETNASDFILNSCENAEICVRQLLAGESLGLLLAAMKGSPVPSYETPDTSIVSETVVSYPRTIQCRLDTYFNGTVNKPRPKCWFKEP